MRLETVSEKVKRMWANDRKILVKECAESRDKLAFAEIIALRNLACAALKAKVMKELNQAKTKNKFVR
jgi:hypothetical protein